MWLGARTDLNIETHAELCEALPYALKTSCYGVSKQRRPPVCNQFRGKLFYTRRPPCNQWTKFQDAALSRASPRDTFEARTRQACPSCSWPSYLPTALDRAALTLGRIPLLPSFSTLYAIILDLELKREVGGRGSGTDSR